MYTNLKFLLSILLIQTVTAIQVMIVFNNHNPTLWIILGIFNLSYVIFTTWWFSVLTNRAKREAVTRVKEEFTKTQKPTRSRRVESEKNQDKIYTSAPSTVKLKSSLAPVVGLVGLGAVLLLSQLITVGLLAVSAAVGVAFGYSLGSIRRTTQELIQTSKPLIIQHDATYPIITQTSDQPNRRRRGGRTPVIDSQRVD